MERLTERKWEQESKPGKPVLKRCPFCGSAARLAPTMGDMIRVECEGFTCGTATPWSPYSAIVV